jgi:hypothetical protein
MTTQETLSTITSALAQTFAPQLVRAWNRSSVFLQNLQFVPGGGQGGGKNVAWDVEFSGQTAASFVEGSDVGATEPSYDIPVPATISWGQYRSAFQLSNLELNAASANIGNPVALERLLEERFLGAITKITSRLNTDAIVGDGTEDSTNYPTIVGIIPALAATGAYANIDKSTYPEWAGNVSANGAVARALTMELLAKAEQSLYTASGQEPELLITTPGVYTKYEGLFQSVFRQMSDGTGPTPSFQGSANGLFWRGRPIIRDKDMTSGYLAMLKPSEIEFCILPWAPVPDGVPVTMRELLSSTGTNARALGAYVHVYPLARTGSAIRFCAEIYCQLKVKRPNEHVLIKDISEV